MDKETEDYGVCSLCGQGMLHAMINLDNMQLLLICDDCESAWATPKDALDYKSTLKQEYKKLRKATKEELIQAGWI